MNNQSQAPKKTQYLTNDLYEVPNRSFIFSFSEADGQMRVILHRPASSRQQSTESGADPHVLYLEKPPESESVDSVFRGETPSEDADDLSIE